MTYSAQGLGEGLARSINDMVEALRGLSRGDDWEGTLHHMLKLSHPH